MPRISSHTRSHQLAQCCGSGVLAISTAFLLRSPGREDQSTLSHRGFRRRRVYFAGNTKHPSTRVAADGLDQLGFVIPLGMKPDQCHDSITPNNMYSDLSCALSAAFLMAGGFAAIMWGPLGQCPEFSKC